MQGASAGTQQAVIDISIGTAGIPTRVFFVELLSGGGGAGSVVMRNGTKTTDTAFSQIDGTAASKTDSRFYGEDGMYFPDGCFVDLGTNASSATVVYKQEVL